MFQLKDTPGTLQPSSSSYLYILTARQYITAKMHVDATNNARPTPDHIRPEKGKMLHWEAFVDEERAPINTPSAMHTIPPLPPSPFPVRFEDCSLGLSNTGLG